MNTEKIAFTSKELSKHLFRETSRHLVVVGVIQKTDKSQGEVFEFEFEVNEGTSQQFYLNQIRSRIDEDRKERSEVMAKPASDREILELHDELSVRALNGLRSVDIITLGDLALRTKKDLRKLRNVGELAVAEMEQLLLRHGLKLKE